MLFQMGQPSSNQVFGELTEKQREALGLAANGLTSKEIARELGISPHSVDKRIDTVRAQLDSIPRHRLVREYRRWDTGCESITGDPIPLTGDRDFTADLSSQPEGDTLLFNDALTFDGPLEWEREPAWLHRGVKPSDLGAGGRLMLVVAGAFLFAAAFVLVAASGNVLVDLLS